MTNNEIDKLLNMLDSKTLNEVKEFLLKQKNKNINNLRQRTFENYMCSSDKKFSYTTKDNGTVVFEDMDNITFSNGISLYVLNKNLVNINSPKIINNMTNKGVKLQHRINKITIDKLKNIFEMLKQYQTDFAPTFDKQIDLKCTWYSVYSLHGFGYRRIEPAFNSKEVDTANILLDNPNFKMDIKNPLLYGENDNGKVYILGYKYNN